MSVICEPMWKWIMTRLSSIFRWRRIPTASSISVVVRPNFAASPPDFAHFPEPRAYSLLRIPIRGFTPRFLATSRMRSSSDTFSRMRTTVLPIRMPFSARRMKASSL